MPNLRVIFILMITAACGGFIAWAFHGSQLEIKRIKESAPRIHSNLVWIKKIFLAGSAPVASANLNGDNTKDMLVSGGQVSVGRGPTLSALDGETGKIIWVRRFTFTISHEPIVIDLNRDGIDDLIISGKSNNIYALNGRNGHLLWNLHGANRAYKFDPRHFNSVALIRNPYYQNGDGRFIPKNRPDPRPNPPPSKIIGSTPVDIITTIDEDIPLDGHQQDQEKSSSTLLLTQGQPTQPFHRNRSTSLYKISAETGRIINSATPPLGYQLVGGASILVAQGKSAIYVPARTSKAPSKIESRSNRTKKRKSRSKKYHRLRSAIISVDTTTLKKNWSYNFESNAAVYPPTTYTDPNSEQEQVREGKIFVLNMAGTLVKINANDGTIVWKRDHKGVAATAAPTVGHFNADQFLDVVILLSSLSSKKNSEKGKYESGNIVWIDGLTGEVIHQEIFGLNAVARALTVDFNGDALDEVIVISNLSNIKSALTPAQFAIFDGKNHTELYSIPFSGYSSSTPSLSDLDNNRQLDLSINIYGQAFRIDLKHSSQADVRWSKFSGPNSNGSFILPGPPPSN